MTHFFGKPDLKRVDIVCLFFYSIYFIWNLIVLVASMILDPILDKIIRVHQESLADCTRFINVDSSSDEFQKIDQFQKGRNSNFPNRVKLVRVQRVENELLANLYLRKKQSLDMQERKLFHGTSGNDPHLVASTGLSVEFGHGKIFGARDPFYSLNGYAHRSTYKGGIMVSDSRGEIQSILLCNFLLHRTFSVSENHLVYCSYILYFK